MGFINLLIPKEKIVGIEINSQKVRMLYLELDRNGTPVVRGQAEAELEKDTIISNSVKDKKKFNAAISKLKKSFKPHRALSPFAVVSIAQNGVYSEIIEFPKTLDNTQLFETISLNAAQNLPLPLSECYMDWQIIESDENKNKVLVSQISKIIADEYISILKENGFDLIALEAPFLSIERATDIPNHPAVFLYFTDDGLTSIVYNNKLPYFSQFETWEEACGGKEIKNSKDLSELIKGKIKKLSAYFESRHKLKVKEALLMSSGFDSAVIIKKIGLTAIPVRKAQAKINSLKNNDWIPAAGAAARAFISRSDDTIISLLPVGTESLYETKKAVSFAKSILFLFFTLAIFYAAVFAFFLALTTNMEDSLNKQSDLRNNSLASPKDVRIEQETKEFNDYVKDLNAIYPLADKNNSAILENINKISSAGITLTGISFTDRSKPIAISGLAATRDNLNAFRYKLENSPYFQNVKFSVGNVAQKENIVFNINLYSK